MKRPVVNWKFKINEQIILSGGRQENKELIPGNENSFTVARLCL